jgi:hypothetical protein
MSSARTVGGIITAHAGSALPVVRTLIVGGGPAGLKAAELADSLPLKHANRSADVRLAVIGGNGIWAPMAQSVPGLVMGQSGLVLETDVRRMTPDHLQTFMPASVFVKVEQRKEEQLRDQRAALFVDDKVMRIRKSGKNDFLVTTANQDQFVAQSIVLAAGGGMQTNASSLGLVSNKPARQRRPFAEDTDALSFLMTGGSAQGGTTLILGGGPSAAWAAAEAKRRHNQVIWVASREHGGFAGANPGGRNTEILRSLSDSLYFGELSELVYRSISEPGDARKGGVVAQLANFQSADDNGSGRQVELIVSQVVTAFGADDARTFSMLEGGLFNDLGALADAAGAFSASPLDAAIALQSSDGDFLTAGATTARALAAKGLSMQWNPIALTLPVSARPLEGIAVGNASIEALANLISLEAPNPFLMNRNQLAHTFARFTGTSEAGRLAAADKFIEMRSELGPGELATWDIAKAVKDLL